MTTSKREREIIETAATTYMFDIAYRNSKKDYDIAVRAWCKGAQAADKNALCKLRETLEAHFGVTNGAASQTDIDEVEDIIQQFEQRLGV